MAGPCGNARGPGRGSGNKWGRGWLAPGRKEVNPKNPAEDTEPGAHVARNTVLCAARCAVCGFKEREASRRRGRTD